jgi:hypothetical protein
MSALILSSREEDEEAGGGDWVRVEFSYDFEVLRVGENHPFSFSG